MTIEDKYLKQNMIQYAGLENMGNYTIEELIRRGARENKMIAIRSAEDRIVFAEAHKRLAQRLGGNELKAVWRYCAELGI